MTSSFLHTLNFTSSYLFSRAGLLESAQKHTLLTVTCAALLTLLSACTEQPNKNHTTHPASDKRTSIRLAVLGDSDSHSYGDRLWFPEGSAKRGGIHRRTTLQWTEVLARLRGAEINQGTWGVWGTSPRAAKLVSFLGIHWRSPEKEDHEYNFAWAGAECSNLTEGIRAQVHQLLHLMAQDPNGWKGGVVQLRIGINVLGTREFLNRSAQNGLSPQIHSEVNACAEPIATSVRLLRQQHPELYIVLVGILDNSDWPPYFQYWQSPPEQSNITTVLDTFDNQLRELAAADKRVVFFDDRKWFKRYWSGRDANGKPNYKAFAIVPGLNISNTQGDSPEHAVLQDGHGGTLLNALWVRDFIDFMNVELGTNIRPVSQNELVEFSRALVPKKNDN